MSFWEFLGGFFTHPALALAGASILGALVASGALAAATFGTAFIADNYGWGWNLLFAPFMLAIAFLAIAFTAWFCTEVIA